MILEYHRPVQIEAALELLAREQPFTLPLGGGTILSRPSADSYAVVDLQALGLDRIERQGNLLVIGATVTLQSLADSSEIHPALRECLRHEAAFNLRQAGTIAGTLAAADGRSPFAVAMMALDARLTWLPGDEETNLGDWLPVRTYQRGKLITRISIPLNARLAYGAAARTPEDRPVVSIAAARWPSGRTRVAAGGYGKSPVLAMDGPEATGAQTAVWNAYSQSDDAWASAEYRQAAGAALVERCIKQTEEL
jgi:CO/xanthine dehydrogenase FAD-binding subunit